MTIQYGSSYPVHRFAAMGNQRTSDQALSASLLFSAKEPDSLLGKYLVSALPAELNDTDIKELLLGLNINRQSLKGLKSRWQILEKIVFDQEKAQTLDHFVALLKNQNPAFKIPLRLQPKLIPEFQPNVGLYLYDQMRQRLLPTMLNQLEYRLSLPEGRNLTTPARALEIVLSMAEQKRLKELAILLPKINPTIYTPPRFRTELEQSADILQPTADRQIGLFLLDNLEYLPNDRMPHIAKALDASWSGGENIADRLILFLRQLEKKEKMREMLTWFAQERQHVPIPEQLESQVIPNYQLPELPEEKWIKTLIDLDYLKKRYLGFELPFDYESLGGSSGFETASRFVENFKRTQPLEKLQDVIDELHRLDALPLEALLKSPREPRYFSRLMAKGMDDQRIKDFFFDNDILPGLFTGEEPEELAYSYTRYLLSKNGGKIPDRIYNDLIRQITSPATEPGPYEGQETPMRDLRLILANLSDEAFDAICTQLETSRPFLTGLTEDRSALARELIVRAGSHGQSEKLHKILATHPDVKRANYKV